MNEDYLNYYPESTRQDGVQYRLDAKEIIIDAIDTFKGGVKEEVGGKKKYYDDQRLMNDYGISRAKMILESGVNKISHLTNYQDEDRVFRQVKSMVRTWIYEVTLNMKKWSPEAYFDSKGKLVNPLMHKIRNKHLVITVIEQALVQSMLRGMGGFEAELTGKQMQVIENKDYSTQQREDPNRLGMLRGGW